MKASIGPEAKGQKHGSRLLPFALLPLACGAMSPCLFAFPLDVALFAPYRVEQVTVKTGNASIEMRYTNTTKVEAHRQFQISAVNSGVLVHNLPSRQPNITAREIRLQSVDHERGFVELTVASLPPQKFKGPLRIKAARDRLLLIERVALEDYVAGVVLCEAADGRRPEALKAQAIVSRTFAVKQRKRHAAEEYNLCSSTHCQVYKGWIGNTPAGALAAQATAGSVLQRRGEPIDAYYSANCGGQTAEAGEIWADAPARHRTSVRDDYCQSGPHSTWRFRIEKQTLLQALQTDRRTHPGRFLRQIHILQHGPSGRVTQIAIEGERRQVVDGWAFRQILSSDLGWSSIKSSLFKVMTAGSDFIFEGRGLGHGVGLCQSGAEAMAQRGLKASEIISHYYPEVRVSYQSNPQAITLAPFGRRLLYVSSSGDWRVRSSQHFLIKFTKDKANEIEGLLMWLESLRAAYHKRTGRAPDQPTEIIVHSSTKAFTQATGRPWWVAAVTGEAIEIQPLHTLKSRGLLQSTLRHEYAHILIKTAGRQDAPRWLVEGFAIHLAGEGPNLRPASGRGTEEIPEQDLDEVLKKPASPEQMQTAYYSAYQKVKQIIAKQGEEGVWNLLQPRIY